MRILYSVDNFPVLSESYIRTEIEYVLTQGGFEVKIVSERIPSEKWACAWDVVYGAEARRALVRDWKPNAIHVHWSNAVDRVLDLGVPVTIRGHSFEFDASVTARHVAHPLVRKIFLFPHQFVRCVPSTKLAPMTVAYNPVLYFHDPAVKKIPLVFRAAAGLANKDLEGFIRIADLYQRQASAPRAEFVLAITTPVALFLAELDRLNQKLGCPVKILHNIPHDACAIMMREAAVYLRSHEPKGHFYGMPASIAEAMASGCFVVGRDSPEAKAYIGNAGVLYQNEPEAVRLIEVFLRSGARLWEPSLERAKQFRSECVLPPLLDAWRAIQKGLSS